MGLISTLIYTSEFNSLFHHIVLRKLQNTPPLICISLNKNSSYCYIPRSSKDTDTCNGWAGVFCNRSWNSVNFKVSFNVPVKRVLIQTRTCCLSGAYNGGFALRLTGDPGTGILLFMKYLPNLREPMLTGMSQPFHDLWPFHWATKEPEASH